MASSSFCAAISPVSLLLCNIACVLFSEAVDCSGDEFSPGADGVFSRSPYFSFGGGRVGFDAYFVDSPDGGFGSVSGFLSQ